MDVLTDTLQYLYVYGILILQILYAIIAINPIIMGLIILYFIIRLILWYKRRRDEQKEIEETRPLSYESLLCRYNNCQEELRLMRDRIRKKAFRD